MRNRLRLGVYFLIAAPAILLLGACEQESTASTEQLAATSEGVPSSPTASRRSPADAPVDVRYRLLTTPQVGQPVQIEVSLVPLVDAASVGFKLRPDDGVLVASNMRSFTVNAAKARMPQSQIVSVTPQREGRFYVNVDASVIVNGEMKSRVVIIPIQVGTGGPELERMGETLTDAEGNRIISLPATKPSE
jgi:hypothetical protein